MTIEINEPFAYYLHKRAIPNALEHLPGRMTSPEARAMLLAIALQESRAKHRVQVNGPAHGFWQFEKGGGVRGVLRHAETREIIFPVLRAMNYRPLSEAQAESQCYAAIVHNDILAAVFARLLLWTVPGKLAKQDEGTRAWSQYIAGWRPGKPHPETWAECFEIAWRYTLSE